MPASKRYLIWMAAFFCATLLPIFALNLLLAQNTLGNNKKALLASEWQQATHGVTYAPTLSQTQPFKTLRLNDRLLEINTVVFGSSTMMSITAGMFPPEMKVYNFSQSGHSLAATQTEVFYLLKYANQVRWFVVPLDWALGFIYQPPFNGIPDLSAEAARRFAIKETSPQVPLVEKMRDALSYPRIVALTALLKGILRAENKPAQFKQIFFEPAGEAYRCPDGTLAKDFETIFLGTCTGFRYDGSATFANLSPLTESEAHRLLAQSDLPSSKYAAALLQSGAEPNAALLTNLSHAAWNAQARGGELLFIMPPLLPGMERKFLDSPRLGPLLSHTKLALANWAEDLGVTIIDAGQSEKFGCKAGEFVDEHHALPVCYAKIFARYWQDKPAAGLYSPQ